MARQIQIRNDNASNWMLHDPILGAGEIGIQIDGTQGNLIKIGNGTSPWSTLSFEIPSGGVPGIQGEVGPAGPAGADGADGVDGAPGAAGTPGTPGTPGLDGTDGVDGSTWGSGAGAPPSEVGSIGDFYLDTLTSDVYSKTGETTWALQVNIKGAPGAKGDQGDIGPAGPTGADGTNGTTTIMSATVASRPTNSAGALYYDTDLNKLIIGNGVDWYPITVGTALV